MIRLNGEEHWKCVALAGRWIAERTPGADLDFILTFAVLHDVMRENDGSDPTHGPRAAQLLACLLDVPGLDGFTPQSQRSRDLLFAISHHTGTKHARDHPNANVGICWDADRVNLWRVWKRPQERFLTTEATISGGGIEYGRSLSGELPSWTEITRRAGESTVHPDLGRNDVPSRGRDDMTGRGLALGPEYEHGTAGMA